MNISFMLTTKQIRNRTKHVTRRLGWKELKPGARLNAVVKGMGLKKGEKIQRICTIEVITVRFEPLRAITDNIEYGFAETCLEGFPEGHHLHWPSAFVKFFCESHKGCTPDTEITRIFFAYV